jgi:hypothetical protein
MALASPATPLTSATTSALYCVRHVETYPTVHKLSLSLSKSVESRPVESKPALWGSFRARKTSFRYAVRLTPLHAAARRTRSPAPTPLVTTAIYRDVFEDLIVRVFEPLLQGRSSHAGALAVADVLALLDALSRNFGAAAATLTPPLSHASGTGGGGAYHQHHHHGGGGGGTDLVSAWTRFIGGVRMCLLFMYSDRA